MGARKRASSSVLALNYGKALAVKLSHFFIERPVFAAVLSAFITIAGAIALFRCRSASTRKSCRLRWSCARTYPGANPKVIAETVAAPLEQAIVGVEDMMYMSSQAAMDGTLILTVTFKIGADVDRAQVQVQNRVAQALPRLPQEVRDLGVTTAKSSPNLMMAVNLTLAGRPLRLSLSAQLRRAERPRRARAPARHGRGAHLRRGRLFDARVARSAEARRAQSHDRRCRRRDPRAEPAGRRRPDRRAARPDRRIPGRAQFDGPPAGRRPVPRHRHQDRRRRPDRAPRRRRARRARRRGLRAARPAEQQERHRAARLAGARLERARAREERARRRWRS